MEIKLSKYVLLIGFLIQVNMSQGQGNPGFIGKKIAVGYNSQFCLLRSDYIIYRPNNVSLMQTLTNHDFYAEYATGKYQSVAFHLGYQKIPIVEEENSYDKPITQTINFPTGPQEVSFVKNGVSDFAMLGIGLKFTYYNKNKTIASPIGLGQYIRIDAYFNRALNNYYKYFPDYGSSLSEEESAYAVKNMDKSIDDAKAKGISLGWGVESKFPITQAFYFKINGEMNFTLNALKELSDYGSYSNTITVQDDLKQISRGLPDYRNMFLIGMGFGVLL
jgi:hypothetical protein